MNADRLEAYQSEILQAIDAPGPGRLGRKRAAPDKLQEIAQRFRTEEPFLYSFLQDTLHSAAENHDKPKLLERLAEAARARIASLAHWNQADNETVAAIEAGQIDADAIKPHIRLEAEAYDRVYSDQSERKARKAQQMDAASAHQADDFVPLELAPNVNHVFRWTHAVALIEGLFGIVGAIGSPETTVRWMDVGCGTGHFANAVNPARFGIQHWDIVGCDFQAGKIAVADKLKAKGRRFFAADAFEMLADYRSRGETFDLVTMFEFLEHLDDPLKFIRRLDIFRPKFVLAGSPLAQQLPLPTNARPDRVHMWSFTRRSWEQMFELAGFEVVYTSEVRVGDYIGGLDWLSIVCGPRDELRNRRKTLTKGDESDEEDF